ncbi:MAG: hypothetical protein EOP04_02125 [Proteobacteria bacterium]|nr:MAG: hypothetical protein EOP04_02125 [Pseudomonadota bacterium]
MSKKIKPTFNNYMRSVLQPECTDIDSKLAPYLNSLSDKRQWEILCAVLVQRYSFENRKNSNFIQAKGLELLYTSLHQELRDAQIKEISQLLDQRNENAYSSFALAHLIMGNYPNCSQMDNLYAYIECGYLRFKRENALTPKKG